MKYKMNLKWVIIGGKENEKIIYRFINTIVCVWCTDYSNECKRKFNDNSTQNTNNNKDNKQDTNGDYGISLCSGNKGKK